MAQKKTKTHAETKSSGELQVVGYRFSRARCGSLDEARNRALNECPGALRVVSAERRGTGFEVQVERERKRK